jgi:site-specific DNA-methyltransferase (adenine-specific)
MPDARYVIGDCIDELAKLPDGFADCVVTDPPYPEIDRAYGRLTEPEWHALMDGVVGECRRVLKPSGSAVFVLKPNSERVGRMRPWLWEFMAKWTREWGMVQDAWWWNHATPPTVHCHATRGLMRPSMAALVWLGPEDCYRDQGAILWAESEGNAVARRKADMALNYRPGGQHVRKGRCSAKAGERGGVTPFNVIPMTNANSATSAGAYGHPAGTPEDLVRYWIAYLCPVGGMVLDPFLGSGTVGMVAENLGRRWFGIELNPAYEPLIRERTAQRGLGV